STPNPWAAPSSRMAWTPAGMESCRKPAVLENTRILVAQGGFAGGGPGNPPARAVPAPAAVARAAPVSTRNPRRSRGKLIVGLLSGRGGRVGWSTTPPARCSGGGQGETVEFE